MKDAYAIDYRQLAIDRLGHRGEGMAGSVFVPYALPGETIFAEVDGERARIVEIRLASPQRIEAFCPVYTVCGGCAIQTLPWEPYASWKRGLVVEALAWAGVKGEVAPLVDAHGDGRRRATFHSRNPATGVRRAPLVGFMQAREHAIVDLDFCPILSPAMANALPAARAAALALADLEKPLDLVVTATPSGLDIDIRGCGALPDRQRQALIGIAQSHDLARIANHGDIIIERRAPHITMGRASVVPPPGAFLQATDAGETILANLVGEGVGRAAPVADLFAGLGTFSLRLAESAEVHAVETSKAALLALSNAAGRATGLRAVTTEARDLVRRPLMAVECDRYDAIVLDPPRAGAMEQMRELVRSSVPTVVSVSCNAGTFARDAAILTEGGFAIERVTPVDQFRHSPHIEIVGVFRRPRPTAKRRRSLLK